jgi:hypothetical protein
LPRPACSCSHRYLQTKIVCIAAEYMTT